MKCFPDLTYSTYADGELAAEEARRVEAHLAECARCRSLVEAWRVESRVLRDVLQNVPAPAPSRRKVGLSILWTAASALVAAFGLDQAVTGLERTIPSSAGWLSQFSLAWIENQLLNEAIDLVRQGPALLDGLVTAVGFCFLAAVIITGVRFLAKRHPTSLAVLAGLGLIAVLAQPAAAIEKRKGTVVSVPAGETVNDSLLAMGDSVDIVGTVDGNVFAPCHSITVRGDVKGDVFTAAQNVQIEGTVEGNIYAWAETVSVSGRVAGSVFGWAQTVAIESGGHVDKDVNSAGGDLRVDGVVGRNVSVAAGTTELKGSVGGNFEAYAGQLSVFSSGRVGGNLEAHVDKKEQVDIEPGASIGGKTSIQLHQKPRSKYTERRFYFWQALELAGAFLSGLVLYWLFPVLFGGAPSTYGAAGRAVGIGFLIAFAIPIGAIVAGFTLVGLPIAILGLMLWLAACYLAKVFVAAWIGRGMTGRKPGSGPRMGAFALSLLVGLIILFIAFNLPYLQDWIWSLVVLLGLGMAFTQWRKARRPSAIG